jgi:hypothetical protein
MRRGLILGIVILSFAQMSRASVIIASDKESDPAYSAGWGPGTNGGSGWGGAWTFRDQANVVITATTASHGWFTATSTGNETTDTNADGDIETPSVAGKAWGLYSNAAANDIYAVRPLASALQVGQTLSADIDNGNVATSQVVGLRLLTNSSDITTRDFELRFVGGATDYTIVNSAGVSNDTTIPFSREGLHVDFTLTTASTYSITMKSLINGTTVTQTGTLVSGTAPIVGFTFKNQEAGTGATANAYLNNTTLAAVPEPASMGLIFGLMGLVGRRKGRAS